MNDFDVYERAIKVYNEASDSSDSSCSPQSHLDEWWANLPLKNKLMSEKSVAELLHRLGWQKAYSQWYYRAIVGGRMYKDPLKLLGNNRSAGAVSDLLTFLVEYANTVQSNIKESTNQYCKWAIQRYLDRNTFESPSKRLLKIARQAFMAGIERQNQLQQDRNIRLSARVVKRFIKSRLTEMLETT